jgi:hypothetical protein
MNPFKRVPGQHKPDMPDPMDFIEAAGKPPTAKIYPWVGADDSRKTHMYNIRLTEAEKAKLEFIVKHTTYKSMQQYCLHILRKAIEADIERLTQTGSQRVPGP